MCPSPPPADLQTPDRRPPKAVEQAEGEDVPSPDEERTKLQLEVRRLMATNSDLQRQNGRYLERILLLENEIDSVATAHAAMLTDWKEGVLRTSPRHDDPPSA